MSSPFNARVIQERRKYTIGQSQAHAFLSTRSPSSSLNSMSAHVYRSIRRRHPRAPRAPYSDTTPCKLCMTLAFTLLYCTFCPRLCGNASCGNAFASSVADLTIAPLHEHQRASTTSPRPEHRYLSVLLISYATPRGLLTGPPEAAGSKRGRGRSSLARALGDSVAALPVLNARTILFNVNNTTICSQSAYM